MPKVPFDTLPDHGRLWVFPTSRGLDAGERAELEEAVETFLGGWAAHGQPLRSGWELRADRFLLVGVDVDAEAPSGCSIDALVNRLRRFGEERGVSLIDHAPVWYRGAEGVMCLGRAQFRELAARGAVDADTVVFDTTLTRIGDLRAGALERPARESWHGRAFFPATATS